MQTVHGEQEHLEPTPKEVEENPEDEAYFEALPRPELQPMEGDVIAYRILHIGPDWTPEVSQHINSFQHRLGCPSCLCRAALTQTV